MGPSESVLASAGPGQAQGGEPADTHHEMAGTLTPTRRHLAGGDYRAAQAAGGPHGRADRHGRRMAAPPPGAVSGALKEKLGLSVEATRTREVDRTKTGARGSRSVFRIVCDAGQNSAAATSRQAAIFLLSPSRSPEHPAAAKF